MIEFIPLLHVLRQHEDYDVSKIWLTPQILVFLLI